MQRVTRVLDGVHARLLRVAVVTGISATAVAFAASASQRTAHDLIVVQVPARAEPTARDSSVLLPALERYVDGARIVRVPATGGASVVLTADFAAAWSARTTRIQWYGTMRMSSADTTMPGTVDVVLATITPYTFDHYAVSSAPEFDTHIIF